MKKILFIIPLLLFNISLFAASGALHLSMSSWAQNYIKDPSLSSFLKKNEYYFLWGSWFPDSGYAPQVKPWAYGEYAHWATFDDNYYNYITNPKYKSQHIENKDQLFAHYLGTISHGFEDPLWDNYLYEKAQALGDNVGDMKITGRDMGMDERSDVYALNKKLVNWGKVFSLYNWHKYTPRADIANVFKDFTIPSKYPEFTSTQAIKTKIGWGAFLLQLVYSFEHTESLAVAELTNHIVKTVEKTSPWIAHNFIREGHNISKILSKYIEYNFDRYQNKPLPGNIIIDALPLPSSIDHKRYIPESAEHATIVMGLYRPVYERSAPNGISVTGPDGRPLKQDGPEGFSWIHNYHNTFYMGIRIYTKNKPGEYIVTVKPGTVKTTLDGKTIYSKERQWTFTATDNEKLLDS